MSENRDEPFFTSAKGMKIVCKYWTPADNVSRGIVMVVHGFGEHCGWYEEFGISLSKLGFFVAAHDHVGHGVSEGSRAIVSDFQEYVDDLFQHIDIVSKQHSNKPVYLLGHSMGGCISILAMEQKKDLFAGGVVIGPLVVPSPDTAVPWKIAAAKFLAWLSPEMGVEKLNPLFTSRDPAVVAKYEADPLVFHGKMKAGFAVAALRALEQLQANLNEIICPLLIIHGDDDKLCEISGSKILHQLASSTDKTFTVYPGAYHQVHSEPDGVGEKCRKEITDWLVAHAPAS